jgi:hypothetical protein
VATFENTVMVRRPIEEVFRFLSDFENVPKWNYAIVETHKACEGPPGHRVQGARLLQPGSDGYS